MTDNFEGGIGGKNILMFLKVSDSLSQVCLHKNQVC